MKFLIIGGDAAGMSAASKAKRNNPDLDIPLASQRVKFQNSLWAHRSEKPGRPMAVIQKDEPTHARSI
jgi:NADPH-dependent 2,4-dienoyl-CoA reductase/sulfur reductase-like enzyme